MRSKSSDFFLRINTSGGQTFLTSNYFECQRTWMKFLWIMVWEDYGVTFRPQLKTSKFDGKIMKTLALRKSIDRFY